MAKRYMDFAPRGNRVPTQPEATVARTGVKRAKARPQPEIKLPEARPVAPANEVPIRLMPTEKVVRRTEVTETKVVQPARVIKPTGAQPVRRRVMRDVSGVTRVKRTGVRAVSQGAGAAKPGVQAVPRPKLATGVAKPAIGVMKPTTGVAKQPVMVKKPVVTGKPQTEVKRSQPEAQRTQPEVKRPQTLDEAELAARRAMTGVAPKEATEKKTVRSRTMVGRMRSMGRKKPLQERMTGLMQKRRPEVAEKTVALAKIADDPLERPVSEFADLEELAQEIEEVTRGGVIEEEMEFVAEESFSLKQKPQFGVVEDFRPRFIDAEVEKRPLSEGPASATDTSGLAGQDLMVDEVLGQDLDEAVSGVAKNGVATEAVATGVKGAATGVKGAATGVNSAALRTMAAQRTKMQIPQAKFINQNKVAKRPLSKVAYIEAGYGTVAGATTGVTKGAEATAKGAKKAKKELKVAKDQKKGGAFGMVLAIVLTVILGAVVGTVAFLILPK